MDRARRSRTKKKPQVTAAPARRRELLETAAEVFAEQGYNATTVREIADAAGILAGSLYYHFDSKESMVDEILLDLPRRAVGRLRRRRSPPGWAPRDPRGPGHRVVPGDRPAPRRRRDLPEGVQAARGAAAVRATSPTRSAGSRRRGSGTLERGVAAGGLPRRPRHPASPTGSCATPCGSPRPGTGPADSTARRRSPAQYLSMVLDGIAVREQPLTDPMRELPWPRPTSSKRSARPSGGAGAVWPACTRPTSARTCCTALVERAGVDPAAVEDVVFGCLRHGRTAGRRHRAHLLAGRRAARGGAGRDRRPAVRLLAAGRALRRAGRCCPAPRTWSSRAACRTCRRSRSPSPSRQAAEPLGLTEGPFAGARAGGPGTGTRPVNQFRGAETDRREVGHQPARTWRSSRCARHRRAVPRHRRGPLRRARSSPYGDVTRRRGPAPGHHPGEDGRR